MTCVQLIWTLGCNTRKEIDIGEQKGALQVQDNYYSLEAQKTMRRTNDLHDQRCEVQERRAFLWNQTDYKTEVNNAKKT
jgi:hypothetical protein